MTKRLNSDGFSAVEGILVLIIVILIGGISFYVFKTNKDDKAKTSSTPSAQSTTPAETAKTDKSTPKATPAKQYLALNEYKAQVPLDDVTKNLKLGTTQSSFYNDMDASLAIIATELDSEWNCAADSSGIKATIGTISITKDAKRSGPGESAVSKKIGDFTYGYEPGGSNCTNSAKYKELVDSFKKQFEQIEAK